MQKNIEIASDLGLLDIPYNTLVELGESRTFDDDEIVYLVTGSQGESRAALWNMASSTFRGLEIEKGDTDFSARIFRKHRRFASYGQITNAAATSSKKRKAPDHVSGRFAGSIKIWSKQRDRSCVPINGESGSFRIRIIKNHSKVTDET